MEENIELNSNLDLDALERRIEGLIERYNRLKEENGLLRSKQANLLNENKELSSKLNAASSGIESIIEKLQRVEMENVDA